jgi:hypothetical protein
MAYQAYGSGTERVTADTPRAAAEAYFAAFPSKRKCDLIQGERKDGFFTITFGRVSEGKWPQSFKDVTKKTAATLPDEQ